jgi:hypothetical protein
MLLYIKLTVRYTSHSVSTNAANIGCCYKASASALFPCALRRLWLEQDILLSDDVLGSVSLLPL